MSADTAPSILYSLSLDTRTLQLSGPRGRVDVSDAECALLRSFVQASNQRLETSFMLAQLGKAVDAVAKHALEVKIVRLRKKIEQAGAPRPTVKAIRGVGYQLCVSVLLPGEAN